MPTRPERGTGTLALLLILLLGAALMLLYANRALLFEQRSAANQARATQAFEAAEAGREWLITQLNQRGESDLACVPVPQAGAATTNQSFRARYLAIDPASGRIDPVAAAEPGCALDRASGWR
ncbi:MAG: pilus assembly PilX N-terminal domain-containing protein, partial [Leptothrix sp. (in: b-proteobacteria)]